MEKKILITIFCLAAAIVGKGQQVQRSLKVERVAHLAKVLSVDRSKAADIAEALDYNAERIRSVARDTIMPFAERQELLKKLRDERLAKIKTILTSEQIAILQTRMAPQLAVRKQGMEEKMGERQEELKKRGVIVVKQEKQ